MLTASYLQPDLYPHIPNTVIIETSPVIESLRWYLKRSPYISVSIEDIVSCLLGHMYDESSAGDMSYVYIDALLEELTELNEIQQTMLTTILETTARGLYSEMVNIGLYTDEGRCWYMYRSLLGNNLVMQLQDPESAFNIMEENYSQFT